MPKIKNLAALAAAVEAGRRYARSHPDQAGRYVDQAAAFVDKQTKGKYAGKISGVVDKVKDAAGIPRTQRFTAPEANGTTPASPTFPTTHPANPTADPFPGSKDV